MPPRNTPPPKPLLVKPPVAASMLAISDGTLARLTKLGEIPVVHIGNTNRSRRYSVSALEAWIQQKLDGDGGQSG